MNILEDTLAAIEVPDSNAALEAQVRLDSLTKPRGSLGYLEEIVRRYAALRRDPAANFGRGAIAVFVADHGVSAAGVSAYPKAVTVEMLRNIGAGGARDQRARAAFRLRIDRHRCRRRNRSRRQAVQRRALPAGRQWHREFSRRGRRPTLAQARETSGVGIEARALPPLAGITLLGINEIRIANGTSAAAILAAVTGLEPARLAGRGTGIDDEALAHKVQVIRDALRTTSSCKPRRRPLDASRDRRTLKSQRWRVLCSSVLRQHGCPSSSMAISRLRRRRRPADLSRLYPRTFVLQPSVCRRGHGLALLALDVRAMLDLYQQYTYAPAKVPALQSR